MLQYHVGIGILVVLAIMMPVHLLPRLFSPKVNLQRNSERFPSVRAITRAPRSTMTPTGEPPPSYLYSLFFPPPPSEAPTPSPTVSPTDSPTLAAPPPQIIISTRFDEIASVALSASGTVLVIGGPKNDGGFGMICIYDNLQDRWKERECLYGSDAIGAAKQGTSVAISGDGTTVVFSGPFDNLGKGAIWVLAPTGPPIKLSAPIDISGFGASVAISGDANMIVVGCPQAMKHGIALLYERADIDTPWSDVIPIQLIPNDVSGNAVFGSSVALSMDGSTVIVGGFRDSNNRGAVWVFTVREEGERVSIKVWRQFGSKLVATDTNGTHVHVGYAVSVSGNGEYLAFSSRDDASHRGAVWPYQLKQERWIQDGRKLVGNGFIGKPYQGTSLALSEDAQTMVFGGFEDDGKNGAVWRFLYENNEWAQWRYKTSDPTYVRTKQGAVVAISENGKIDVQCSGIGGRCWIRTHTI